MFDTENSLLIFKSRLPFILKYFKRFKSLFEIILTDKIIKLCCLKQMKFVVLGTKEKYRESPKTLNKIIRIFRNDD